jgi:DNA-directed RNA polymerase subunit RPC12/RpoP
MNDYLSLNKDTLREQLKARNVMKREMRFFYAALLIGIICSFVFGLNSFGGFLIFFLFLIAFRTTIVWYQWNFLLRFNLKCPNCNKPLAEKTNLFISPSQNCPHCGQKAMAPIKQLVEFEKSENT